MKPQEVLILLVAAVIFGIFKFISDNFTIIVFIAVMIVVVAVIYLSFSASKSSPTKEHISQFKDESKIQTIKKEAQTIPQESKFVPYTFESFVFNYKIKIPNSWYSVTINKTRINAISAFNEMSSIIEKQFTDNVNMLSVFLFEHLVNGDGKFLTGYAQFSEFDSCKKLPYKNLSGMQQAEIFTLKGWILQEAYTITPEEREELVNQFIRKHSGNFSIFFINDQSGIKLFIPNFSDETMEFFRSLYEEEKEVVKKPTLKNSDNLELKQKLSKTQLEKEELEKKHLQKEKENEALLQEMQKLKDELEKTKAQSFKQEQELQQKIQDDSQKLKDETKPKEIQIPKEIDKSKLVARESFNDF